MADAGKNPIAISHLSTAGNIFSKKIMNVGNSPLQDFWFSNNHPSKKFWPFFNDWAWVANKYQLLLNVLTKICN